MDINFYLSEEAAKPLKELSEKRGVPVPALVARFVEQGLGRVCMPCAGMGTNEDASTCVSCKGAGINPMAVPEYQQKLRRYQLMVKHIALLAEDPHPLKYERAGGDCVCGKCGLAYFDHPKGSMEFLTLLCDGSQVKL